MMQQTKRCVLHSVLLMTGLQWVTRPLQSPVWGLRLVHSMSYLAPLHSITAQTRDSIIAISRVSPASLSLSSQRQRSHRVPEKSLAVILVTILLLWVFSSHCMQWPAAGQHPPIAAEWGLQCQAHCSAHVIIEILPELLIEEFSVTTLNS